MTRAWLVAGMMFALLTVPAWPAQAQSADDLAEVARQAARAGRHPESIDAFERAIAAAPERRREWLVELADQLTWSGRLQEAIGLYRKAAATTDRAEQRRARRGLARALSWDGDHVSALAEYDRVLAMDPGDREVRLARAQVLSWSNQQRAALEAYEAVLRDHPQDLEARRGIGRVQSWRARYRDAAARMQQLLQDDPRDREATVILAESLDWMGRPDRAERVLRDHVAADAGDTGAAALLENLAFYQRPEARVDWRESHQSDDLRMTMVSLGWRRPLWQGRSFIGLHFDRTSYQPAGGAEQILVDRPGVRARHRISDAVDWHGSLFVDLIDTGGAADTRMLPTYETYLTLWPNDVVRFDLGSSRWTFDSEEALRAGLTATDGKASMDVVPNELTRLTSRVSLADYSDGNRRTWWQFEVERRVWEGPRLALAYRYTGFDFVETGGRGYYNPDLYHSNEVQLRGSGWSGGSRRYDFRVAVGYEHEIPGDSRLIWNAGASVIWEIQRQLPLEVAYDFSSSKTASAGGFERGAGRIALRYAF